MNETYNTKAIILNKEPFRERDFLITVYSADYGKLKLVARGARVVKSKISGHIEPVSLSNIMIVRGKSFEYAGSAVLKEPFANIKNDLEKIHYAGKAIALLDKVIKENDKTDSLNFFELLNNFLKFLNNKDASSYKLFFNFFVLKLIDALGYSPKLDSCVKCGRIEENDYCIFNLLDGGIVCSSCNKETNNHNFEISNNCIQVLESIKENNSVKDNLDNKIINELNNFVKKFKLYIDNF